MGEVWLVRTPWAEPRYAALKCLRADLSRSRGLGDRFRLEASIGAQLRHPNVVRTLEVGEAEGRLFVVSELVFGRDVRAIAERLHALGRGASAAVALHVLASALEGLAYVHGATDADGLPLGLVHRDLTPGNLLVGFDGRTVIADFGLARSDASGVPRPSERGERLGTPRYLAPEVVDGAPATPASDLYGLGAVMVKFLTGHSPPASSELGRAASSTDLARPLEVTRPDLPPWLSRTVLSLLEADPSRRPGDAARLASEVRAGTHREGLTLTEDAVAAWLQDLFFAEFDAEWRELSRPDPAPVESPPDPLPRRRRRLELGIAAALGLGLGLGLALVGSAPADGPERAGPAWGALDALLRRSEPVPPGAWEHLRRAIRAEEAGAAADAALHLDALERALDAGEDPEG